MQPRIIISKLCCEWGFFFIHIFSSRTGRVQELSIPNPPGSPPGSILIDSGPLPAFTPPLDIEIKKETKGDFFS